MFLIDWFYDLFTSWGFIDKQANILFLGLDNAGKTTLMHLLRNDRIAQHKPTRNPTNEELVIGGVAIKAHDLGGHKAARKLWKDYFHSVDAIVYVVDSARIERIDESRCELDSLLSDPLLNKVPFMILGNKIDIGQINEVQFKDYMNVTTTTGKGVVKLHDHVRPIEVFMCSLTNKQGYGDGFKWLSQYIK